MNSDLNYMNLRWTKQIAMSCMTMNISKNSYSLYEFYELSFKIEKKNGQVDVYEGKVEGDAN